MTVQGFAAYPTADRAGSPPALDEAQTAVLGLGTAESAAVIGAPGTGKTTTLIEFVADRILLRGLAAEQVLVLAPTRQTATRLRDRLALRTGVPTRGPLARTPSSLAFQLVGARAQEIGEPPPRLLTGGEQDQIIAELLRGHVEEGTGPEWPESLSREVRALRGFRTELRELMARCTEQGITPARLAEIGRGVSHSEWVAAADFIDEYQHVVDSYRGDFVDSAELLAQATVIIRSGTALRDVRLVVVDDLQEATISTIAMLRSIASRGAAVVAFGDPDVSTTGFRGADPSALGQLGSRLGTPVTTLVLDTVHRHGSELRRLTGRATDRIGAAAAGRQRAAVPSEQAELDSTNIGLEPVVQIEATSAAAERVGLARLLREHHLLLSIPWNEMAVIVRSGSQVPAVARALAVAEVPTRTSVAGQALRDEFAARQLIRAAGVSLGIVELSAEVATELLLGPLGGLDGIALRRLRLALRQEEIAGGGNRAADDLLVEALSAAGRLATIESAPARRAGRLAGQLQTARELAGEQATIEEILWALWDRSGLAAAWLAQSERSGIAAVEAHRHLDGVVALFTAAKRFVERNPGRPAADFVEQLLGAEVPEDTLAPQPAADTVLVCTPSGAIGAEFAIVGVAGLQEGTWPNLRLRGSLLHPQLLASAVRGQLGEATDERADVLSDELRMFGMAVSRARKQVILTATANDDEQPSAFTRLPPSASRHNALDRQHSLTLRGVVGRMRRQLASASRPSPESDAARALARLEKEGIDGASPASWYGLAEPSSVRGLVDENDAEPFARVSPSKLETWEKSPLAWFIDTMAATPSGVSAGIGTIVHGAMEEVSTSDDHDVSIDRIWQSVEERWGELQFESPWVGERERGRTRRLVTGLAQYLHDFDGSGGILLESEGTFSFILGAAIVSGTIDRIERSPNGEVMIVDLKTGKAVPSAATVHDHAQLGIYQLALAYGALGQSVESVGENDSVSRPGGAKLVFVGMAAAGRQYKEVVQAALDESGIKEFSTRIAIAAAGMSGSIFDGVVDLDEHDPHSRYEYRIHLIPAVSS